MSTPTASSFQLLLTRLDREPLRASAKYEDLRLRITRILHWKGCPESEADALADTTLDRIAHKLSAGEQIEDFNAYAAAVVRFVWLEHCRRHREESVGDDMPETATAPDVGFIDDADERMSCLRECLAEVASARDDRRLIIGYYDADAGAKNKDIRKNLAKSLGITMTSLKVRACRLRARLEACINECVDRVTKTSRSDTHRQEAV